MYSLAGASCIDVAADLAVVHAACEGIAAAQLFSPLVSRKHPWLMVSLNDGQDPHFRKAWFDVQRCPVNCHRPCEQVCPAYAIPPLPPEKKSGPNPPLGVVAERCYGCGRCLPICPNGLVKEESFTVATDLLLPTLLPHIQAIEIHTQVGRHKEFQNLWQQLTPYLSQLQLVAISCPDSLPTSRSTIVDYLIHLYQLMEPKPPQLLWQTDGRSMSGDIGKGTTHATIRLAQKVLNARLPGYVQLAGGTNNYTVAKLRSLHLLKTSQRFLSNNQSETPWVNGIAYGSYARQLIDTGDAYLENDPQHLCQQVNLARTLVGQINPDILSEWGDMQLWQPQNSSARIINTAVPP